MKKRILFVLLLGLLSTITSGQQAELHSAIYTQLAGCARFGFCKKTKTLQYKGWLTLTLTKKKKGFVGFIIESNTLYYSGTIDTKKKNVSFNETFNLFDLAQIFNLLKNFDSS
jgi:hypothetical protein